MSTWYKPVSEANHIGRPEPEAAGVRLLVVVLPMTVVVEAALPQAYVLELIACRWIGLRPIRPGERHQRAQAAEENQYACSKVFACECGLANANHSQLLSRLFCLLVFLFICN